LGSCDVDTLAAATIGSRAEGREPVGVVGESFVGIISPQPSRTERSFPLPPSPLPGQVLLSPFYNAYLETFFIKEILNKNSSTLKPMFGTIMEDPLPKRKVRW